MSTLLDSLRSQKSAKQEELKKLKKRKEDIGDATSKIESGLSNYDEDVNFNIKDLKINLNEAYDGDTYILSTRDNNMESLLKECEVGLSDPLISAAIASLKREKVVVENSILECEAAIKNLNGQIDAEIAAEAKRAADAAAAAALEKLKTKNTYIPEYS